MTLPFYRLELSLNVFKYITVGETSSHILFLLIARTFLTWRRGVHENKMYILRTDDRPATDLAFWKISNGHISATDHPIHLMFGAGVGFSRSADRVALLLFGPKGKSMGENNARLLTI